MLKAVPSEKLAGANRKMREKIPGFLLVVLYILSGAFIFGGVYILCHVTNLPVPVTYILSGAVIGAFIGLVPLVDVRNNKDNSLDNKIDTTDTKKKKK